jgi:hypothetical protein
MNEALRELHPETYGTSETVDESDAETGASVPKTDVQDRIDSADYLTLKKVGGRIDGIDGSGSASELRTALHTDADPERVGDALDAVRADTTEDN